MALIQCYECDARISSLAMSCPQCGAPAAIASHAVPTFDNESLQQGDGLNNQSLESTPANHSSLLPKSLEDLMLELGISTDGEKFRYKTYLYGKVEDAINYARVDRAGASTYPAKPAEMVAVEQASSNSEIHIHFAWFAALFVLVFGAMMFRNESIGFAIGNTVAGLVIGLLLSPIIYFASRIFTKHSWQWYHWVNAACFTALAIEMAKWFWFAR